MPIEHTVGKIVRKENSSVSTTAAKLFGDNAITNDCDAISICNNHATQTLYVKWMKVTDAVQTDISSTYDESIAATKSSQFQFKVPRRITPEESIVLWIQGSGASTTYSATKFI